MAAFMKKLISIINSLVMVLSMLWGFIGRPNDIVILYTNDVHCAIDANIGYAGLASYKDAVEENTPYVTLVDCGDAIQGDYIGAISDGEYIIDIMNEVGYDFAVLGNHEFDYGMERLNYLIGESDAEYLSANISYTGDGNNELEAVEPYKIVRYGFTSVAFIGVSTPNSITSSTPAYFMDDSGNFIYNFCGGDDGSKFFECVQDNIDECKRRGADYVVVCSHLGDTQEYSPYSAATLVDNTSGIDVVLDAHAHNTIPCRIEDDKDGNDVLISSTGTKLQNIGQLVITPDGEISTGLVSGYAQKDAETESYINGIKDLYEADMNKVVATSDTALSCYNAEHIRIVRTRETAIGNLCADAYRAIAKTDIAFVNGGGIRADIPAGDITNANMIAVHPYGNTLCSVKASGSEILDALEMASRKVCSQVSDGTVAVGENGGFLQVSGLKYTVDTSIESSVVLDANQMFVSVSGARRVKDVMVLGSDGIYRPIDKDAIYTVASHNYMLKNRGDGINMFADNEFIINEGMVDYEIVINYITNNLNGNVGSKYSSTEGRITIV